MRFGFMDTKDVMSDEDLDHYCPQKGAWSKHVLEVAGAEMRAKNDGIKAEHPHQAVEIVYASLAKNSNYADRLNGIEHFRVHLIAPDEVEGADIVEQRFVISVFASELREKEGAE
jgi:hypothetical protein